MIPPHFYKTCLEWPFHSTNRHKNCQTRLCELPHIYQKFSKARFVKVHFGHLECEFRQNFQTTSQKTPNNPISSLKLFLCSTKSTPRLCENLKIKKIDPGGISQRGTQGDQNGNFQ